jgi:hypothetical protein
MAVFNTYQTYSNQSATTQDLITGFGNIDNNYQPILQANNEPFATVPVGGTGMTPAQIAELTAATSNNTAQDTLLANKMNKTTGVTTGAKVLLSSGTTGLNNVESTVSQALLEGFDARILTSLPKNTAITAGTKTKITYDANGLVTAGADATATDIIVTPTATQTGTTGQAAINNLDSRINLTQLKTDTATVSIVAGNLTTTQKIRVTDQTINSDINVDDFFVAPTAKNSAGKIVLARSLLVVTGVQPTPTPTGNTTNLNSTFKDVAGDTWIVDGTGVAIKAGGTVVLDGNQYQINRTNATAGVQPANTVAEALNPISGDTAIVFLSDNKIEYYAHNGTTWGLVKTIDPTTLDGNDKHITHATAGILPTLAEVPTPAIGDTAKVKVTATGNVEFYSWNGTVWVLDFTIINGIPTNLRYGITAPAVLPADKINDTYIRTDTGLNTGIVQSMYKFDGTAWKLVVTVRDPIVDVTGVTPLPIVFPITTLPGTPVFAPNVQNDTDTIYRLPDGTVFGSNGTQYIANVPVNANNDFWRKNTGTTVPNGTNDTTVNLSRLGKVGFNIADPSTLKGALENGGSTVIRQEVLANATATATIPATAYNLDTGKSAIVITQTVTDAVLLFGGANNSTMTGQKFSVINSDLSTNKVSYLGYDIHPNQSLDFTHNGRMWQIDEVGINSDLQLETAYTVLPTLTVADPLYPSFTIITNGLQSSTTSWVAVPNAGFIASTAGEYAVKYVAYCSCTSTLNTPAVGNGFRIAVGSNISLGSVQVTTPSTGRIIDTSQTLITNLVGNQIDSYTKTVIVKAKAGDTIQLQMNSVAGSQTVYQTATQNSRLEYAKIVSTNTVSASVTVTDNTNGTVTTNAGVGQIQDAIRPINELPTASLAPTYKDIVYDPTAGTGGHKAVDVFNIVTSTGTTALVMAQSQAKIITTSINSATTLPTLTTFPIGNFVGQQLIFTNNSGALANISQTNTELQLSNQPFALASSETYTGIWDGFKWVRTSEVIKGNWAIANATGTTIFNNNFDGLLVSGGATYTANLPSPIGIVGKEYHIQIAGGNETTIVSVVTPIGVITGHGHNASNTFLLKHGAIRSITVKSSGTNWEIINDVEEKFFWTTKYLATDSGATVKTFNTGGLTGTTINADVEVFQTLDGNFQSPLTLNPNPTVTSLSIYADNAATFPLVILPTNTDLPYQIQNVATGQSLHFEWSDGLWRWRPTPVKAKSSPAKRFQSLQNLVVGANIIPHNLNLSTPFYAVVSVRDSVTGSEQIMRVTGETANSLVLTSTVATTNSKIVII